MSSLKRGRNSLILEPEINKVWFRENRIVVEFRDGRRLSAPLEWYPALHKATDAQRNRYDFIGQGEGVIWDSLDEVLSAKGFLQGLCEAVL